MTTNDLPALNAILNGTSAILLTIGFIMIRRKKITAHRACMSAAFITSTLFLISYLTFHALHGSTRFTGQGWVRPVYFLILGTHTLLAVVVIPFVLSTFYPALKKQFARHVRVARWTLPIWLYVSVTGVVIYLMLYQIYPARTIQ